MQKLVEDVKQFGRIPKRNKGTSEQERAENILAKRFWRHRNSIPKDILQELHDLGGALQPAVLSRGQELIDAVQTLGFFPKETKPTGDEGKEEFQLAAKIRKARERQLFTPAEQIELNELKRTLVHPRDCAMSAQLLEEAQEPPNPMECFADEAENRLDQDLLLLASGNRTKELQRRLKKYRNSLPTQTQRKRNSHRSTRSES